MLDAPAAIRLTLEVADPGPAASLRLAARLSRLSAAVAAGSCVLMLAIPSVVRGPAVMAGSARGTALAVVALAVPVVAISQRAARRGSGVALPCWLGGLGLLAYNALMFLFATPLNNIFLAYIAWLGLTAWSVGALVSAIPTRALAQRFSYAAPVRLVSAYVVVVALLNAAAWLRRILTALVANDPASVTRGLGVETSVAYVQDLALWLPLMVVAASWLWRRRPLGYLLVSAGLVMWVLESATIALDQAYGAAADPSSSLASARATPAFLALAAIGVVPILLLLNGFDGESLMAKASRLYVPWPTRSARRWSYAGLSAAVGAAAVYGGVGLIADTFNLPHSWLGRTPFTSWTMPGVVLLAGVAGPQLLASAVAARGSSWGRLAGAGAGLLLVAWIAVQLLVLARFSLLQPMIAVIGVVELWLVGRQREDLPWTTRT